MDTPEVMFLVGIPGSGKTTFAKKLCMARPEKYVCVSSDWIRRELYGNESIQGDGKKVFDTLSKMVGSLLYSTNQISRTVIVDATNVNLGGLKSLIHSINKRLPFACTYRIKGVVFDVDYSLCVKRNSERSRVVPEDVMARQYNTFRKNRAEGKYEEVFDGNIESFRNYTDLEPDRYTEEKTLDD